MKEIVTYFSSNATVLNQQLLPGSHGNVGSRDAKWLPKGPDVQMRVKISGNLSTRRLEIAFTRQHMEGLRKSRETRNMK